MSKYTELITNYHATKPKFLAHVDLMTRPLIDVAAATRGLITAFDIDSAVGVQLDILGLWIGRSRVVSQPISGVYFSWDTDGLGYDQGYGRDHTILIPDTCTSAMKLIVSFLKRRLRLITGMDGMIRFRQFLTLQQQDPLRMQIVDNQDMTISVWVFPDTDISDVSRELIAAIKQGYLTVKAAGVWAGGIETPSVETPSEGSKFLVLIWITNSSVVLM